MSFSATVPETAPPSEKRLAAALQHRFFLRVHMAAILTGTILVGLFTSRALFAMHVHIFALRYAIAVVAAWVAFVGCVKLWLAYIGFCAARAAKRGGSGGDDWADCFNFSSGGSSSSSSGSSVSFGGGGGKFGGGGASGGWEEGSGSSSKAAVAAVPVTTQHQTSSSSSSSHSSGGGGGGGSSDDLGELILVVLIIAVVVAVIASFAWMVWAAPGILGETAFNAALAGALTRHAHNASHGNWIGSVMKKTAVPFILVLALSIAMGAWAQHYCPSAVRLQDALPCVK